MLQREEVAGHHSCFSASSSLRQESFNTNLDERVRSSHMNFHPGGDISARFLLKRRCVRSSHPKHRFFICLFAGKQTDKTAQLARFGAAGAPVW